jgi:predicted DCC family thiol-disulfide oxidoreductase YuxK
MSSLSSFSSLVFFGGRCWFCYGFWYFLYHFKL